MPELWNYLVGQVLTDEHEDAAWGRATVEARIDRGHIVTPIGLGRSRTFKLLYDTGAAATFGQTRALRCPHYNHDAGGLCGVWRHRESTCATWFCKYVRGAAGQRFWQESVKPLLASIERALSFHCLTASRFEFPLELLLAAFDGRSLEETRRNILEDFGFELEPDLIQRLLDFGILSQES